MTLAPWQGDRGGGGRASLRRQGWRWAAMLVALACAEGSRRVEPAPAPTSAADRIVAAEKPAVEKASSAGEIAQLRAQYAKQQELSITPQAYQCLLGMLYPRNSPEARALLRQACTDNETFALARLAYARSVANIDNDQAGLALREAWRLRPEDPEVARAWGEWRLDKGDEGAAVRAAGLLLQKGATSAQRAIGNYLVGRANWQKQDWEAAYGQLAQAAQALPGDVEIVGWWIRLAVDKGRIAEAGAAVGQRQNDPPAQSRLGAILADALNAAALRELAPSGEPASAQTLARRRALAQGYDKVRAFVPYGVAWDIERLAIWLDITEGRRTEAWRRFTVRVPAAITREFPGTAASRYATLESALKGAQGRSTPQVLRRLRSALEGAGWTAEALEVARGISSSQSASADDVKAAKRLEAHQTYLGALGKAISKSHGRGLGPPPLPPAALEAVVGPYEERHPVSGTGSLDPLVLYFRRSSQYFCWWSQPWEDRAYRLMEIFFEEPLYKTSNDPKAKTADIVVGEDLVPAGGGAASSLGQWDAVERDHGHVSVRFDSILNDIFTQQADREARLRLEAYSQEEDGAAAGGPLDPEAFSPDVLAAMAQALFENHGIGACALGRPALPRPEECRDFRNGAIEALVELLARKQAFHLALQSRWGLSRSRRELQANLYALASSRWPDLGLYYAYRNALAGDDAARAMVWEIAMAAAEKGFIRKNRHPLMQLHFLSDLQIPALAQECFRKID